MEFLKEFLDEGRSRIKSNVFASVFFAFVAVNWQPLYLVAFENIDALSKFKFFEDNTTWQSLYVYPLIIGALLAVGLPFINNMAHWAVSRAINETRIRDDEYAHQRLKKKNQWEEERLRARELYAEKLISQAQIDQNIDAKVQNPEKREEIRAKIEETNIATEINGFKPEKFGEHSDQVLSDLRARNLSKGAEVWLKRIKQSPYGCINQNFDHDIGEHYYLLGKETFYEHGKSQDFDILESVLSELTEFGLLKSEGKIFSVTRLGETVVDEMEEIPF